MGSISLLIIVTIYMCSSYDTCIIDEVKYLKNHLHALSKQTMLQQFFTEQRVRTEGQSGLKLVRQRRSGTKNYFVETHTGGSAAAVHDHSNNIRTVGMGEFTAVLNGVEFTTRHNDYSLRMPHKTSKEYHATEDLPFPDVPQEVLDQPTIQGQIDEMREWFKAFRDQNYTKRDYRKYFKPALCYLEGTWTNTGKSIDEPFKSDRHFVDANTWMELHEKTEFTAYTGGKSRLENLSFLPTKIVGFINETIPVFAQWNYRILCHPVKRDIPLDRIRLIDDLTSRMMYQTSIHRYLHSRAARFQLNSEDSGNFKDRPITNRGLLDEIMEEIPGKDNYAGELYDEGLDTPVLNDDNTKKDVSRYHRWFKVAGRDAMGVVKIHRGYSDDYMFAAMTTQPRVAGKQMRKCKQRWNPKSCYTLKQKWSYAIPLELHYMTPLYKWNPYNLKYHGKSSRNTEDIVKNKDRSRNGACINGKEFNGTHSRIYYQTPAEFYSGGNVGSTAADTVRGSSCILDQQGVSRAVRASGTHVFLPSIKDVGVLRTRYPLFPVHGEGSTVFKELNAFKDIYMKDLSNMKWSAKEMETNDVILAVGVSHSTKTTGHTHEVILTAAEVSQIMGGRAVFKTTSIANGHEHVLEVRYNSWKKEFYYHRCDNNKWKCWDNHDKTFTVAKNEDEVNA